MQLISANLLFRNCFIIVEISDVQSENNVIFSRYEKLPTKFILMLAPHEILLCILLTIFTKNHKKIKIFSVMCNILFPPQIPKISIICLFVLNQNGIIRNNYHEIIHNKILARGKTNIFLTIVGTQRHFTENVANDQKKRDTIETVELDYFLACLSVTNDRIRTERIKGRRVLRNRSRKR